MKYLILFFFPLILLLSCSSPKQKEPKEISKPAQNPPPQKPQAVEEDTVESFSFMNFFEKFMYDETFQKTRIDFPIFIDKELISDSASWKHRPFFTTTYAIPILNDDTLTYFDKDIDTEVVTMSIIDIYQSQSTDYFFNKTSGQWLLTGVSTSPSSKLEKDDFFTFLKDFSQDSLFQVSHVQFPLPYQYTEAALDYEMVDDTLSPQDWEHFPVIEKGQMLLALDVMDSEKKCRDIFFRGVENGIYIHCTFRKIQQKWLLVDFIDGST